MHRIFNKIILPGLLLGLLFAASSCLRFDYNVNSISGVVTDEADGAAVSGAIITVSYESDSSLGGQETQQDTTNNDGYYSFSGLPNQTHTLTVSKTDYEQLTRQVELENGKRLNLVMTQN
mgnify:CR=1 FL=1